MTSNPAPQDPNPLLAALAAAQARWQLFPPPGTHPTPVLVAVSGGVDSNCLLHLLHQVAQAWRLDLHVGHVDHRLRPSSAADARFVAGLSAAYGHPFHLVVLDPEHLYTAAGGIEAAARHARYAALGQMAASIAVPGQMPAIVLAHHADDQAETILMHLVQGSSLRGLGGMRPVGEMRVDAAEAAGGEYTVRLVRPLLAVRRSEIQDYVRVHRLEWCEDLTNQELHLLRNRLRHQILPVLAAINPNLVPTLGRNAALVADEADRLDALDRATLQTLLAAPAGATRIVIQLPGFQALAPAARRGLLRQAITQLGGDLRDVGFERIDELAALAGTQTHRSGPHPLPGGLAWTIAGDAAGAACLSLHRQHVLPMWPDHPFLDEAWRTAVGAHPLPDEGEIEACGWKLLVRSLAPAQLPDGWRTNTDAWLAWLDADTAGTLELTTSFPGAIFAPLGMDRGHKHLGDLFTDQKIPVALRTSWPLIADRTRRQVSWVCGLQISHRAAITAATRRVLRLKWERLESRDWRLETRD